MPLRMIHNSKTERERLIVRVDLYEKMISLEEDHLKRYNSSNRRLLNELKEMQKQNKRRLEKSKWQTENLFKNALN